MGIYEIVEHIKNFTDIAHVNTAFIGDVYELNHRQDVKYPASVITQGTHESNETNQVDTYSINVFLVDRLLEDKSNELDVQDWAIEGLKEVKRLCEDTQLGWEASSSSINPFTERFDSLCAGAFMTLRLSIQMNDCFSPRFVTSVNGKTGDVRVEVPLPNLKTINGRSLIGSGDIELPTDDDLIEVKNDAIAYTDERVNALSNTEYEHYTEIQGEFGQVGTDIEDLKAKNSVQDREIEKNAENIQSIFSNYATRDLLNEELAKKVDEAPKHNKQYVRKNGYWEENEFSQHFFYSGLYLDEGDDEVKGYVDTAISEAHYAIANGKTIVINCSNNNNHPIVTNTCNNGSIASFSFVHKNKSYIVEIDPSDTLTTQCTPIIEDVEKDNTNYIRYNGEWKRLEYIVNASQQDFKQCNQKALDAINQLRTDAPSSNIYVPFGNDCLAPFCVHAWGSTFKAHYEVTDTKYVLITCNGSNTEMTYTEKEIATTSYVNDTEERLHIDINKKQDKLVSGENIKTINGESLIGEGNIEIKGDEIKAGDGIYITEDAEGAKVISTKPYSTTANTYVAWNDVNGNWNVDYYDGGTITMNAYSNRTEITKVEIGDDITSIGEGAFHYCTSLTNIEIPNSVTSIDWSVFASCKSLTSVTIPNSVTTIGGGVFQNCSSLTSIEIPNSVTSISGWLFQGCSSLTSVTLSNSITSIGNQTFYDCPSLTSVTIPNSVTSIGNMVFENVPTQGTLYCDEDWYNNLSQTQITNLGNVYNWARKSLKPIDERVDVLEDKVDNLEPRVTTLEEKVEDIELSKVPNVTIFGTPTIQNGQVSDFSNDNYLQFPFLVDLTNKSFAINMCFTTSDNVTAQQNIFDSNFGLAFAIKNGRFIAAISSNGTSWNSGELQGYSVVNPNTTYYYKIVGIYNNDNITTYQFLVSEDNVEFTEDMEGVTMASPYPRHITIGKSIDNTHIFNGSINLNNCNVIVNDIELWRGMDSVGLATRLATDLSNIDASGEEKIVDIVSNNLKTINGESLIGEGDIEIKGGGGNIEVSANTYVAWCDEFDNWTVDYFDNGTLPEYKYSYSKMKKAIIGEGITRIGIAFDNSKLKTLYIKGENITWVQGVKDGSTTRGFYGAYYLEDIYFLHSHQTITKNLFWYKCSNNIHIHIYPISSSVLNISGITTNNSVKSYDIIGNYTTIGGSSNGIENNIVFDKNSSPTSVIGCGRDITSAYLKKGESNTITSIGNNAFSSCSGLTSIVIPNANFTSIGNNAFYGCINLIDITFNNTIDAWKNITKGSSWNYGVPSTCKVHCTDGDCDMNGNRITPIFDYDADTKTLTITA